MAHAQETDASSEGVAEVEITQKARTHFRAGVNLLQDPDGARYEEAYRQFKAAYAESPSWKILGNLGLCAMNLERDGEAIDAFAGYLEGGRDSLSEQEVQQYQRDLETLRATVGVVQIAAPSGSTIVDKRSGTRGADVNNYYVVPESGGMTLRVRPGQHEFRMMIDDKNGAEWSVTIDSQAEVSHEFRIQEEDSKDAPAPAPVDEEPGPSLRIPAYAAFGVGAVGVAAGAAFLVVRGGQQKKASDLYNDCVDSLGCGPSEQSTVESRDKRAATFGTLSLVSFGVGAVGLGTGLALLLMDRGAEEKPLEAQVGPLRFSPYAGIHQLGLTGSF